MNEVEANARLSRHLAETEKYPGVRCLCNLHCLDDRVVFTQLSKNQCKSYDSNQQPQELTAR